MSTDNTMNIINEYKDKIQHIIHEEDSGIYDAMNKGIKFATGDIIAFINADDWYEKGILNHVKNIFDSRYIDVYSGRVLYINRNGEKSISPLSEPDELFYKTIPHQGSFVRKTIFEEFNGFSNEYLLASDYDFFLKSYCQNKVFYYDDYVVANYSLDGSSSIHMKKYLEESLLISKKYANYVKNEKQYKEGIDNVKQDYGRECENDWFFEYDNDFKSFFF